MQQERNLFGKLRDRRMIARVTREHNACSADLLSNPVDQRLLVLAATRYVLRG